MKLTLITIGVLLFGLIALIAWCGYPWSLAAKITRPEVIHIEPEGMVNNEDYPSVIRIQTWNLGFLYGLGSEGVDYWPHDKKFYQDKIDFLVSEIKASAPDILCLQEVDFDSERSSGVNQAQYLAIKAAYPYVAEALSWESNYVPFPYWPLSRHFGQMKSGGAILSKYPITSHVISFLKKPDSKPWWYNLFYPHRYLQQVEIELGDKKVKLVNLHLEAFDKVDRLSQVKILVDLVKTQQIDLVAGDFNTLMPNATKKRNFPNSKDDYENDLSYSVMEKSGLLEVIPDSIYSLDEVRYFTFPSSKPNRRLDYIFYDKELKMIKAEVLPSALSDHLPLKASMQIGAPKFNPYSL